MKFIQLTVSPGVAIYVSPTAVIAVEPLKEPSVLCQTLVWLAGKEAPVLVSETLSTVLSLLQACDRVCGPETGESEERDFPYHPDVVRYLEIVAYLIESGRISTAAFDIAAEALGGTSMLTPRLKTITSEIDKGCSIGRALAAVGFPEFLAGSLEYNSTAADLAHRIRLARSYILAQLTGKGGAK